MDPMAPESVYTVTWEEAVSKFEIRLPVKRLVRMQATRQIEHVLFETEAYRLVTRCTSSNICFYIRLPEARKPRCTKSKSFIFKNTPQPTFCECDKCHTLLGDMYATCNCCGEILCLECAGVLPSGRKTICVDTTYAYRKTTEDLDKSPDKGIMKANAVFDMSALQRLQMAPGDTQKLKSEGLVACENWGACDAVMQLQFEVRIDDLSTVESLSHQQRRLQDTPRPQGLELFELINSKAGKVLFDALPCDTGDNSNVGPFSRWIEFKCADGQTVCADTYTIERDGPEGLNAIIAARTKSMASKSGEIQVDLRGYDVNVLRALLKYVYTRRAVDLTEVKEDSRIHFLHHLLVKAHELGMAESDVRHLRELYNWLLEAIGDQFETQTEETLNSVLETAARLHEHDLKSKIYDHLSKESKKAAQKKRKRDQDAAATAATEKKQKSSSDDTETSTSVWNVLMGI